MQKKLRKLNLSRETLRLLDLSNLKEAQGGIGLQGSFDRTCQSLCEVCDDLTSTC
jgi:hypothetical protein